MWWSRGRGARTVGTVLPLHLLGLLALLTAACGDVLDDDLDRVQGSGDKIIVTRDVDEFDRVVLSGEGRVLLGDGVDGLVEIETDDNIVDLIETTVADGTLTISTERGIDIDPSAGVVYRLGCPDVARATLSGAGLIDLADCTTTDQLSVELRGAGNVRAMELEVSTLEIVISGAGDITASGTADQLDVLVSGAGDLDAADLRAADADIEASGVGSATVWATDRLDVRVTGVGSVRYFGEPAVTSSVTGLGTVDALGQK